MKNKLQKIIVENVKIIFFAGVIAIFIRSLFFQPFYIPSSSMEPTLLIGDRIIVSKYSYGYSKHSFPFSPPILSKKILFKEPKRGDLVVFKTPRDNRTDFIKRLIGLPGDRIKFENKSIIINGTKINQKKIEIDTKNRCGPFNYEYDYFIEELPNGIKHKAAYKTKNSFKSIIEYVVPKGHYFLIGDNRDCSNDSRYDVGYVKNENLIGKAQFIFFSNDTLQGSILKLWQLNKSIRLDRFFKKLK